MIRVLTFSVVVLATLLAGCATKSPETFEYKEPPEPPKPEWNATTCQNTHWYELGLYQGLDIDEDVEINEIAEKCLEAGVNINTADYLRGLETNAKRYCTPEQGYQLGVHGQHYPKLCIPEVYSKFYFEWYRAMQQYCHKQSVMGLWPPACEELKD